uniref:Thioesterase domain-containing protein n=1 Tax=Fagus sylvatica TaxID=28930 RepID=A0A2N9GUQ7_FAGSY
MAMQNYIGTVYGGAVAAIAEMVSIACARTVVSEDKELFLGELSMSYLSGAQNNAEVLVDASVVRSGRNLTVVAVEFKLKKTEQLIYTARATFYNRPVAML